MMRKLAHTLIPLFFCAILMAGCSRQESAPTTPIATPSPTVESASQPASPPAVTEAVHLPQVPTRLDGGVVTADNFARAETDRYFGMFVARAGGKFFHRREFPLEDTGVRANRDTLYSEAVFDLDAGPVTVTLPDSGDRFLSLMVIDQDHYVRKVAYGAGTHRFSKDDIGTRYLFAAVRILVNPASTDDMAKVAALQNALKIDQPGGPGRFEFPAWDVPSLDKARNALVALNDTLPDLRFAFGNRDEVDPVRHLIGTAAEWGGNPDKDALYLNITPAKNDGKSVYRLSVPANVPVDAFWSVTVYDANGYFKKNALNAYSFNSITAKRADDGSVVIQFGDCSSGPVNCLPIMPGWNYMVRLYRPRAEVLNGQWQFPVAAEADNGGGK